MTQPRNTVLIEDAKLIFKNFSGKEGQYNREGNPEFSVLLDEEIAATLAEDGWNVKWLKPREGEEEPETPQAYLPVAIGYKVRPPRIVLITSRGRENLDKDQLEMLDWAEIINVDMIVNPSPWEVNGKTGIKAYLQSMYVTIEEDPLERKYAETKPK